MKPTKTHTSKLKLGLVPAGTDCPFRGHCGIAQAGACKHQGKDHTCDFSCAMARGFDLIQEKNVKVGPVI